MGNFILHNNNCTNLLKDISGVNLIVTSPPYNAEKEYEGKRDIDNYKQLAKEWFGEIENTLTDNGSLWLNVGYSKTGANTTLPLTYLYYSIIQMPLIQEIVWHYEGGMSYKKRFTHRTERWMWFCKNPDKVVFNLDEIRDMKLNRTTDKRNHPLGKNPTDYWYFDRVVSGTGKVKEKTEHPCQFPIAMIERIITACSNENDTVMDMFMGSGTTGIACKKLNRNFIGIEKDEKYFKIAETKIKLLDKAEERGAIIF